MKTALLSLLFVGLALGYSTSYYGWVPQKEYVYHYKSQVLTGIPGIRSQWAGLKLTSRVKIQSFPDYSLRIQFENPKFLTVNNEHVPEIDGRLEVPELSHEEVPEAIRRPLVTPFEAHIKRGVVEALFVEKNEPVVVTNIKKSLLAQLQTDLSGVRQGSVQKLNHLVLPSEQIMENGQMRNISFFKTMETSTQGDCETSYTIHPLPLYQAREMEEQWKVFKIKAVKNLPTFQSKMTEEKILKESREAEEICKGQQYYQITKTKNFDNCRERPVFTSATGGLKNGCDPTKAECPETMVHLTTTRYVVCGHPEQFTIRKVITDDQIAININGWNVEEKVKSLATIELELLKVQGAGYTPLPKPTESKTYKSLILEYPEKKMLSSKGLGENMRSIQRSHMEEQMKSLTGFYPIQPMPELNSAPQLMYPTAVPKPELYRQVTELMHKIIRETFESPESCSCSTDVAGYIVSISKAFRTLTVEELKEVQTQILRTMETQGHETKKVASFLYYDILSMVGTNPSIILVKELIESGEIPTEVSAQVLQTTLKNVKTPTPELMNMILSLVKSTKSKTHQLFSVSTITFSDLLYRACINPTSMVSEFPVGIYGNFCNPETSFIKEQWIPYLETELESSVRKSPEKQVAIVHALGKLGHYKAITPLVKVIEGEITKKPIIRSMAVYSLKRIATQYPAKVNPIVLSLIDNPAENTQVRIAAVAVLPFTTPSVGELQKVALRTWFEPSRQVASFIYSTFKSLKNTQTPRLLPVRQNVETIMSMVKKVDSGVQFSHNIHGSQFFQGLKVVFENGMTLVNTEQSLIPNKISMTSNVVGQSFTVKGLEFSLYSQGMDYVLEKILYATSLAPEAGSSVRAELQKLQESLQIKKRETMEPEAHLSLRFMGLERLFSFNSDVYFQTLQKVSDELRTNPKIFTEGLKYEYTKAVNLMDLQMVGPSETGFPVYQETVLPVVYSIKGVFQAKKEVSTETEYSVPTVLKSIIKPIVNVKLESTLGVISPFTKQFIGSGVQITSHTSIPTETKVTLNKQGQVAVSIKTPENIVKEIELLHMTVKPFTFKKSLQTIVPASQSAEHKKIVSNNELKKVNANPALSYVNIDAPIKIVTDYKVLDLATIAHKLSQASGPINAIESSLMPRSLRYISVQLRYNPTTSPTKELETRFSIARAIKPTPSENIKLTFPKGLTLEHEIKKMCVENHQSEFEVTQCIQKQLREITSTADVSQESMELCKINELKTTTVARHPEDFEQCLKAAKICEQSKVICLRKSLPVKICHEKKVACQVRQSSLQAMKTILRKMNHGSALSLSIEASVNSHYEKKTAIISVTGGSKVEGLRVKSLGRVAVKVPQSEEYIVETEVETKTPEIKTKWNLDQLLSDDIKLESVGEVRYGFKSQPESRRGQASAEVVLMKTESQKQSVLRSPEYKRCIQEEGQGKKLSPICEKVRHQAVSADKLILKVKAPRTWTRSSVPKSVESMIKAYFLTSLTERYYESSSVSNLEENEVIIETLVSRQGEEAQLKVQRPGLQWEVKDIRMPYSLKDVLPISLRNGIFYRLVQKSTAFQTPSSCRIESQWVSTFDNKTYPYTLNDCEHLLMKDCSGQYPIAVTARGSSSQKEVKIISGLTVVELKPTTGSVLSGIRINGQPKTIRQGELFEMRHPHTGRVTLQIQSYLDGVVVVREFQSMLEVSFDGQRIEVVAPQLIRTRACGICGDMNGESTADIRTPKMCVFKKPRIAAYTYMIKESCQGVPTQDKQEYEAEIHQCIKKNTMTTPISSLAKRLIKVKTGPAGIIMKHLIEYRANGNEICFTKHPVPTCEGKTVPSIGKMTSVPFVCLRAYTTEAKHLKMKVESNQPIAQMRVLPTTYNRMVEQPSICKPMGQTGSGSTMYSDSYSHSDVYSTGSGSYSSGSSTGTYSPGSF